MKFQVRTRMSSRSTVISPNARRLWRTGINTYRSVTICSNGATTVVVKTSAASDSTLARRNPKAAPIKVVSRELP